MSSMRVGAAAEHLRLGVDVAVVADGGRHLGDLLVGGSVVVHVAHGVQGEPVDGARAAVRDG